MLNSPPLIMPANVFQVNRRGSNKYFKAGKHVLERHGLRNVRAPL